jgi:anti-sigma-K factor RskA
MSTDAHVLESLSAYALGCLDESEDRLVSEHLSGCHICRTELQSFQSVADQLALAAPDAVPSPELKHRLLQRVDGVRPTRSESVRKPLFRFLSLKGALGLLLILALLVSNILLWRQVNQMAAAITGPQGMRAIALHSSALKPDASGFVIISADGENGVLVVDQLPVLETERTYQLWLVRNKTNTSAALFSVDQHGYRGVRIMSPESLFVYSEIRVTIEPAGGSATPTGEQVLVGNLFNQ